MAASSVNLLELFDSRLRIPIAWFHDIVRLNFFQLDVLCHRLLTTLADSKPGKEYEDRAYNTSLLLRKLACQHPMLLLR